VERGLERRDELLKLGERQADEIQERHRAGREVGESSTSHGSCLLSQSCDVRGASYQKESGINSNGHVIPNDGERYRHGEAMAPGFVASTVNQVVRTRFCTNQPMQGAKRGAPPLLQTRVKTRNRE
jgi:hypothetical protein